MDRYQQAWLQKREDAYVAEHGAMPSCACGCGEPVKMNSCGKPQKYAGINHQSRVHDMAELSRSGRAAKHRSDGDIPLEKFREVVERVKKDRGLTWAQLSEMAGVHPSTLRSRMYDHRKKYVTRGWATAFFNRCSGITTGSVPTPAKAKRMEEEIRRIEHQERMMWRDMRPKKAS